MEITLQFQSNNHRCIPGGPQVDTSVREGRTCTGLGLSNGNSYTLSSEGYEEEVYDQFAYSANQIRSIPCTSHLPSLARRWLGLGLPLL